MEENITPKTEPNEPGYLFEKQKRKNRQQELLEQYAPYFPKLKNGLLEIGCGHGHWLTEYSDQHPNTFCMGVDLIAKRINKSETKADRRSLDNVLFVKAEAIEFLELIPDNIGIAQVMVLFPDPWPKKRHHRRRLIQHDFLKLMAKKMAPAGKLYFRTDHAPYFDWSQKIIGENPYWELDEPCVWPMELPTYFQRIMGDYQSLCATVNR